MLALVGAECWSEVPRPIPISHPLASTTKIFHRGFDPPSFDARPNFIRRP